MPITVALQYQVIDKTVNVNYFWKTKYYKAQENTLESVFDIRRSHHFDYVILAETGYTIHIEQLSYEFFLGDLFIFDGLEPIHQLLHIKVKSETATQLQDIYTNYMASLVSIFTSKLIAYRHITLKYRRMEMDLTYLQMGSRINIQNRHKPMIKVIAISPTFGVYPNVSMTVRTFGGQCAEGCRSGGYAIRQFDNSNVYKQKTFGPYCKRTGLFQPFIDDNGMQYLVSGKFIITFYYIHILR